MSREAGVVVANLQNLCIILADSAEVAAEVRSSSACHVLRFVGRLVSRVG